MVGGGCPNSDCPHPLQQGAPAPPPLPPAAPPADRNVFTALQGPEPAVGPAAKETAQVCGEGGALVRRCWSPGAPGAPLQWPCLNRPVNGRLPCSNPGPSTAGRPGCPTHICMTCTPRRACWLPLFAGQAAGGRAAHLRRPAQDVPGRHGPGAWAAGRRKGVTWWGTQGGGGGRVQAGGRCKQLVGVALQAARGVLLQAALPTPARRTHHAHA